MVIQLLQKGQNKLNISYYIFAIATAAYLPIITVPVIGLVEYLVTNVVFAYIASSIVMSICFLCNYVLKKISGI